MKEPWLKKPKEEIQLLVKLTVDELREISETHCVELFWIYEQFQKELQKERKEE